MHVTIALRIKVLVSVNSVAFFGHFSTEERTTLPNENVQSEESKPVEDDGGTEIATEQNTEHTEDNGEKDEEKSDDQEKEE